MIYKWNFNFVKHRNKFFALSLAITLAGILTLAFVGLHYGIDFKAGTTIDIVVGEPIEKAKADQLFQDAGLSPTVTVGGTNQDRVTARFDYVLTPDQINQAVGKFISVYGDKVTHEENTVDPQLARELAIKAIYAVAIASIGIVIYVAIRFEWRFALAGIIALLHDAFIVISVFSIFRLEVNLTFVAAVLTIVGYSINDTIVIFDRIRENLRFAKIKTADDLSEIVNKSLWQTMTRSINTVLTVLFGAIALMVLGSESLRLFSLAMLVGLISGAYSSICVASPLWFVLKRNTIGRNKKAVPTKA